jgi:hypothetical protein
LNCGNDVINIGMDGVIGTVIGSESVLGRQPLVETPNVPTPKPQVKPNSDKTNVLSFYADTSGCAHYRIFWPESIIRGDKSFNFSYLMRAVPDPRWYDDISVIRIQRQVSDKQLVLAQFLKKVVTQYNARLCYEIDDLPFYKHIPEYNQHKQAYANPEFAKTVKGIMNSCDEITTTTKGMRDIIQEETGHQNVTIIPNFVPRLWMGHYYDEEIIRKNFTKNKKKPRILYAGSGAHYSIDGKIPDDFSPLVDLVRKTHKEFQWVFYGGFPRKLVDLLQSGKVEYHPWVNTMQYPEYFRSLKANISIAPLQNNTFNRAKSDIKFTESCAYGIPSICQDMVTYENALNKFDTANDLYDQIKRITKDAGIYMKESRKSYNYIQKQGWMEDNIHYWKTFLKTPIGHPQRELLTKFQ